MRVCRGSYSWVKDVWWKETQASGWVYDGEGVVCSSGIRILTGVEPDKGYAIIAKACACGRTLSSCLG
jgi:hypothetical protein